MWKDYSISNIKNNRAGSISVFVSVFIAVLFLSFLCSLFYNFWQDEINGIQLEEGNWHGRITGEISEKDIRFIQNYANVETAMINQELSKEKETVVDIRFYHVKTAIRDMEGIAKALELEEGAAVCHLRLLAMYFVRDPKDKAPRLLFPAYFVVVVITCISLILIIHNSFAVSMNARIQQFGIFSSIGATPGQILTCLMQEAAILAFVPAILGLLCGIILCSGMIHIMNAFIAAEGIVGGREAVFQYHPAIFAVTCTVSVITIVFSAWLPAGKLSKLTPLEAIRGKDMQQIKKKKNFRILSFLFGIEGELAGLAFYAQKRAMRTAAVSLLFSFFAFIMMMSFFTLSDISTEQTYFQKYKKAWDIMITLKNTKIEEAAENDIWHNMPEVRDSIIYQKAMAKVRIPEELWSEELSKRNGMGIRKEHMISPGISLVNAPIIIMEDISFMEYCRQIGIEPELNGAVILNRIWDSTESSFRQRKYVPYIKENQKTTVLEHMEKKGQKAEIPVLAYTDKAPVLREEYGEYDNYVLVHFLPVSVWKKIQGKIGGADTDTDTYIRILAKKGIVLSELNELEETVAGMIGKEYSVESENRLQEKLTNDNMIHGMMLVSGVFCVLIAMIGIVSVFSNTLNFLRQRKREFARYLSIGMTPAGMKKLFFVEALIIGGRPLMITLPPAVIMIALMIKASYLDPMVFLAKAPIVPVLIFIFAVFALIGLAYGIGGKKVMQCDLISALRDDTML